MTIVANRHLSETMTVDEAAARLGIGRRLAYEAVQRGEIPVIRLGRRLLGPRAALDAMLQTPSG